ncbi:MAG TPA: NUDIX domain-containing protein [Candidatus Saccharimonadales bacterium]|nr:NUDIX domain-containing protein [Candidatus Saccharimonadales bacterium]
MGRTVKTSDLHGDTYNVPVEQLTWRPSAYAIVVHDGKLLLSKQFSKFHLPGGGIELGETPEEAVIREVKEETGFDVADPRPVEVMNSFFTWKDETEESHFHSVLIFYQCRFVGGEASIDDIEEYEMGFGDMPEWIPLEELEHIPRGSTYDWLAVVRRTVG